MKKKPMRLISMFILVMTLMLIGVGSGFAADKYWMGAGVNVLWSNAANWAIVSGGAGGNALVNGDIVHFDGLSTNPSTSDWDAVYTGITIVIDADPTADIAIDISAGANTIAAITNSSTTRNLTLSVSGGSLALSATAPINVGTAARKVIISNTLGGAFGITKSGAGILELNAATNTFSGILTISAGTVTLGNATAPLAAGSISMGGGILLLNAAINAANWNRTIVLTGPATISTATGASVIDETIDKGTSLLTLTGATALTLNGAISGSGGLTVNMAALAQVVTLGGVNTYTGTTTITRGMLTTSAGAERITDTSPVDIAGAAVDAGLTLGLSETIGALSGTGDITMAAFTLTVSQTTNTTYSGIIGFGATAGNLVKAGSGALTLSGANVYTGTTTVNAGTLSFDGVNVGLGAVTVNNALTKLAGTGTIPAAVTMETGTILAPGGTNGDLVGTLTITGLVLFNGTSKYVMTMTGGAIDKIVAGAALTATGSTPTIEFQAGYSPAGLTLPAAIMTITGAYTAFTSGLPAGYVVDIVKVGNDIRLTATPSGVATITAYPTKVPKGAYVNGPLGGALPNTDDNFFWQTVTLTLGTIHAAGANAVIALPAGMYVADVDGDGIYTDEVAMIYTTAGACVPTISAAAIGTITILFPAVVVNNGDVFRLVFPVTSDVTSGPTGTYTVAFTGGIEDITTANGQLITFVDPTPNALQLVSFATNLSGNNDSTSVLGDRYPDTIADTFGALPDLIVDSGEGTVVATNRGVGAGGGFGYPVLDFVENSNETSFAVWVSRDSTLAHVDSLTAGVFHAVNNATLLPYTATETNTGNISYNMSGYPEGTYYFYITSYLTGDFPLVRSGGLVLRHWPLINILAWDRDHNGSFIQAAGDNSNLTMDTGLFYKYDGTVDPTASNSFVNLYSNVLDLDDNAKLSLFYSTNAAIDTSAVLRTGTARDSTLTITGLTGAMTIKMNLLENQQDEQGFIKWRWNVDPDSVGAVVPANVYTVYGVLCDGKHFTMSQLKGSDGSGNMGATTLTATVHNSPKLLFDSLAEYDTGGADIQIDVARQEVIMISWGKSGINGDIDLDDTALIELYAVRDDTPATPTYDYSDGIAIRAAYAATPQVVHRIASGLSENLEAKNMSWFAWDLKKDFKETGWAPVDMSGGAKYILYGIIDENKTGGTIRVVVLGPTDAISLLPTNAPDPVTDLTTTALEFTNSPFSRLFDPPVKGVTINAEETYRLKYYSFDWDAGVSTGQTGIFIVNTNETGYTLGPATTLRETLAAAADGKAYCLTSTDGTVAAGVWLTANTDSAYYDLTISPPGTANTYVTSMGGATDLTNGTYWVYIGIDPNNNGFIDADTTEILYRAPGTLTIQNISATAPAVKNLFVSPMELTTAQGDTTQFTLRVADNGATVDRIDAFIAVEKTFWTVVSLSAPFTAGTGFTSQLIANQAIDDAVNNRWILRGVAFQSGGAQFTITNGGLGDPMASFRLVSKGTSVALGEQTSVYFVNEPMNNRVSKFSSLGADISINTLASTVKVIPRAIVEGIVQLEGRNASNVQFTFDLRKRGSYEPVTDSLFIATNDSLPSTPGIQYRPDTDGKFTFMKVPTGQWDMVVKYNRYISPLKIPVDVYPGADTVFVNFGVILGGDCMGYVDSLGAVYPDNQIVTDDLNRIRTAFLAISTNPKWNNGVDNWKWADINEDNVVEVDDLAMATKNVTTSGAQPVYKIAAPPENANLNASVDFMNVPSTLKAGQTYTIQVVAKNTDGVRAYFVNMKYDTQALTFEKIRKGDFISSDSYTFPVMGEGKVGLVNSAYGEGLFSGDGVLAEVTFTAARDGVFASEMLGLVQASFVNKDSMKQNVLPNSPLNAAAAAPLAFSLGQNFPNPFNPTTSISFSVPEAGQVKINIYDILGRNVRTLISGQYAPGRYSVVWDAKDSNGRMVSSGTYLYTIAAGKYTAAKRMLFMK